MTTIELTHPTTIHPDHGTGADVFLGGDTSSQHRRLADVLDVKGKPAMQAMAARHRAAASMRG